MDRGFTDGALWWWLHDVMEIIFYVPAKKNMAVYQDAKDSIDAGIRKTRERVRYTGSGKNQKKEVARWDMVGIEGLTSAGFYGPKGSGSHENAKDFIANPINAVLVVHDPFVKNNPQCDSMVILTNDCVKKPLVAYDRYDRPATWRTVSSGKLKRAGSSNGRQKIPKARSAPMSILL
jgi:hypothetical protein